MRRDIGIQKVYCAAKYNLSHIEFVDEIANNDDCYRSDILRQAVAEYLQSRGFEL